MVLEVKGKEWHMGATRNKPFDLLFFVSLNNPFDQSYEFFIKKYIKLKMNPGKLYLYS